SAYMFCCLTGTPRNDGTSNSRQLTSPISDRTTFCGFSHAGLPPFHSMSRQDLLSLHFETGSMKRESTMFFFTPLIETYPYSPFAECRGRINVTVLVVCQADGHAREVRHVLEDIKADVRQ